MSLGTEHRKLAAIMFTDMVGYSALSQRRESLALELLEEHRRIVRGLLPAHSGREVKTTGDGFLIEFPSALAAVEAAVAIQNALHERSRISSPERQLQIRIGIHVGDVVMREGDIHGDGVNIAARLEPLAEAGGICLSRPVVDQVGNKIEAPLVKLAAPELKNIQVPVEVYRLVLPWEKGQEESRKQRVESTDAGGRPRWGVALVGLAVVLGVGVGWWQVLSRRAALEATKTMPRPGGASPPASDANPAPGTLSRQRLVLLPLKSLASGEANEIFTDGLAVELFSKLSHIRGLQVIDGSGFVKSQGEAKDYSAKWRELNAGALLKGTVLKEQKQLRIRLQLLDSQTQELLKAFDFDREPESVLALQTEAAEAIATTLEVQLLADEHRQLSRRPTENPRAYQCYLEGRAFWSRYTEAGWRRSIELFNDAIRFDPNFAPAYAGLADSYAQLGMDFLPPGEGFALVKTNALRAIQLEPELAPAYVSLAQCQMWFDRDGAGAKQSFETALRLQPRYPDTYHFFSHYYETLGQMPRAIELLQQGIALDPLSSVLQTELGWAYFHARRYAEGAAECRKVLASDPTFDYARYILGLNLMQAGQQGEAVRALEQAWKPLGWASVIGDLGYAYALTGKTQQARDLLQQLHARKATTPWQAPSAFGFVHLGLGETNQALAEFERAVEAHDVYMSWIKVEPRFDPLRNEPRFQELLQKVEDGGRDPNPSRPSNSAKAAPRISSLAIKPLDDFSGNTNNAYLSDGMTEALCSALGNISALRVPGRSTIMRYKHSPKSIPEMARELNVDAIVEGSLQREGDRLRINIQLIEAATDRHLWSTNYDRDMGDFFKVQTEVARAIATEIQVRLTPEDQARLVRARSTKPEAVEAYLLGMHHYWQWSDEGTTNAVGYFRQAIEIEPGFAPAHAGLALAYIQASTWIALWRPSEGVPQGKAAAQRAIELDPMIADAYVAMGFARMNFDWDWAGAEKDFKRALELNPRSSSTLDGYANLLTFQGRFDDGLAVWTNALTSDPLSSALHYELGWGIYMSGQFGRSIPIFQRALELDRNFLWARLFLGSAYLATGKTNQALAEFQATKKLAPDWPWVQSWLGHFYGVTGRRAEAMQILAELDQLSRKRYLSHFLQAYVCMGLGQRDAALEWLEQAYEERDGNMSVLKIDQGYVPLRNEPRFQSLLKKVGLAK